MSTKEKATSPMTITISPKQIQALNDKLHNLTTPGFASGFSTPLETNNFFFSAQSTASQQPLSRSKSSMKREEITLEQKNELGPKLVVVMVGLPARGKSYISKKLFQCRVFNVGNKRRVYAANIARFENSEFCPGPPSPSFTTQHDAHFFDASNVEANKYREQLATETLEELINWLHSGGGKIGILDATNSTIERRKKLCERIAQDRNLMILFIESICTEGPVLESNIEMKLNGPDYKNHSRDEAILDFKERIVQYEKVYQTLGDEEEAREVSYCKIINIGKKVTTHNIHGYIQSHCVFYLMQLNIKRRTIWLTRHGESQYNLENRIGGDPSLTESGVKYGLALGKFLQDYYQNKRLTDARNSVLSQNRPSFTDDMQSGCSTKTNVWTSTLNRTIETVESFDDNLFDVKHIRFLNEIYAGTMENLTYDEFENLHTDEYNTRMKNKLQYRYPGPGGESYLDVIERLRPLIIELERMESDTVICTHNVVMRTLVAYFVGMQLDKMPTLGVPLHTLYRLRPVPYGCELTRYSFDESSGELVEME